jgi:hypothetical protein
VNPGRPHEGWDAKQTLGDTSVIGGEHVAEKAMTAGALHMAATMRELDMAVIMGGPRFRPWVDALIDSVQKLHTHLSRTDSNIAHQALNASPAPLPEEQCCPNEQQQSSQACPMRADKRMRNRTMDAMQDLSSPAHAHKKRKTNVESWPEQVTFSCLPEGTSLPSCLRVCLSC